MAGPSTKPSSKTAASKKAAVNSADTIELEDDEEVKVVDERFF